MIGNVQTNLNHSQPKMEEIVLWEVSAPLMSFLEIADFGPISVTDSSPLRKQIFAPHLPIPRFYKRRTLCQLLQLYLIHVQKSIKPVVCWDTTLGQFFPNNCFPCNLNRFLIRNVIVSSNQSIPINYQLDNLDELLIDKTHNFWTYHLQA